MQDYTGKAEGYFSSPRTDIAPLLPADITRVLEVGCGTGATLRWLKTSGLCRIAVGVELFDEAANLAREHADEVLVGDAEVLVANRFEAESFDLILCLDVLEHLVDPWRFMDHIERLLKVGGTVICSIPNVRHLSVLLPLVFAGHWRYSSSGLLDRTHLRFFTREGALDLATTERLRVSRWLRKIPRPPSKIGIANVLSLGLLKDVLAFQYLIASTKWHKPSQAMASSASPLNPAASDS